jgi:hypothetical protein
MGSFSPDDLSSLNLTGAPPSRGVLPGMFELSQWHEKRQKTADDEQ